MNDVRVSLSSARRLAVLAALLLPTACGADGVDERTGAITSRSTADASWQPCTWEGGTCAFSGTRRVLYGVSTSSQNVIKTFTANAPCTDATFGDPAYGVPKSCWVETSEGPQQPPPASWVACTWEGGTCAFSGTRRVLFGVSTSSQNVIKTFTANAPCTDATFGDPAYGVRKSCWYESVEGQPPPSGFARPQIFAMAQPSLGAVEAGQDVVLRMRFWAIAGQYADPSKVFAHFRVPGTTDVVANLMDHWLWVPSDIGEWSGYREYAYYMNVPDATPAGTYTVYGGIAQGVSPYSLRMQTVDCNGIERFHPAGTSTDGAADTCAVGSITVTPHVNPTSPAFTGNGAGSLLPSVARLARNGMYYALGQDWAP